MTTAKLDRFWAADYPSADSRYRYRGHYRLAKVQPHPPHRDYPVAGLRTNRGGQPGSQPQKIDINRAEAWLLEALPGIGPSKAQAIIDYRQQNGGFSDITEILEVEGIGQDYLRQIKDLITVGD